MRLIAHRGNLNGPCPERENDPVYIEEAIAKGFDVEVDVWGKDGFWWLGHDEPQYLVSFRWFSVMSSRLWLHCKSFSTLNSFAAIGDDCLHWFWHENDAYSLTSNGLIWTNRGKLTGVQSVLVELDYRGSEKRASDAYAICTDYPNA